MAHFVKWRGAFNDQGSPKISHSIQGTLVGQAFRFGIWGGDGLDIGPNDPSIAQTLDLSNRTGRRLTRESRERPFEDQSPVRSAALELRS